jgi:hypothetical protein
MVGKSNIEWSAESSAVVVPATSSAVVPAAAAGSRSVMVLPVGDGLDDLKHIYTYRSSGVQHDAVLILHEIQGLRLCEFMTRGFIAPPHGVWRFSQDNQTLIAKFNYRFNDDGSQDPELMPWHPTRVDRVDQDTWSGMDDKACIVDMVHVRSLIRSGNFWVPTSPL